MSLKKIKLDNGLRVILAPQAGMAATALVLVEAGSKYETKEINGLSHFLEHMCFKGTERRPRAIDISMELDALGAQYNAFTSQEYTGYYAKARRERLSQVLQVVADLYLNPVFRQEEIDRERGVIIEEINMYEDLPQRRVQELFTALLYGDQPAGWDVAGEKEVIRRLKQKDFIDYRSRHYVAGATIVVVAGNFKEEEIISEIRDGFAQIAVGLKDGKLPVKEEQTEPQLKIQHKQSDQTHLVLGVRAVPAGDARRYALEVLADVLGGGMSSRLFQRVREELGAAYYVRSGLEGLTDHGYLEVSAGVEHGKLEKVVEAVLQEMRRLREEPVGERELNKSKEHIVGQLALSLETSDELATFAGLSEVLRGEVETPEELMEKIRKVTPAEVKAAAELVFKNEGLNSALIGPFKAEEQGGKIRSLLKL